MNNENSAECKVQPFNSNPYHFMTTASSLPTIIPKESETNFNILDVLDKSKNKIVAKTVFIPESISQDNLNLLCSEDLEDNENITRINISKDHISDIIPSSKISLPTYKPITPNMNSYFNNVSQLNKVNVLTINKNLQPKDGILNETNQSYYRNQSANLIGLNAKEFQQLILYNNLPQKHNVNQTCTNFASNNKSLNLPKNLAQNKSSYVLPNSNLPIIANNSTTMKPYLNFNLLSSQSPANSITHKTSTASLNCNASISQPETHKKFLPLKFPINNQEFLNIIQSCNQNSTAYNNMLQSQLPRFLLSPNDKTPYNLNNLQMQFTTFRNDKVLTSAIQPIPNTSSMQEIFIASNGALLRPNSVVSASLLNSGIILGPQQKSATEPPFLPPSNNYNSNCGKYSYIQPLLNHLGATNSSIPPSQQPLLQAPTQYAHFQGGLASTSSKFLGGNVVGSNNLLISPNSALNFLMASSSTSPGSLQKKKQPRKQNLNNLVSLAKRGPSHHSMMGSEDENNSSALHGLQLPTPTKIMFGDEHASFSMNQINNHVVDFNNQSYPMANQFCQPSSSSSNKRMASFADIYDSNASYFYEPDDNTVGRYKTTPSNLNLVNSTRLSAFDLTGANRLGIATAKKIRKSNTSNALDSTALKGSINYPVSTNKNHKNSIGFENVNNKKLQSKATAAPSAQDSMSNNKIKKATKKKQQDVSIKSSSQTKTLKMGAPPNGLIGYKKVSVEEKRLNTVKNKNFKTTDTEISKQGPTNTNKRKISTQTDSGPLLLSSKYPKYNENDKRQIDNAIDEKHNFQNLKQKRERHYIDEDGVKWYIIEEDPNLSGISSNYSGPGLADISIAPHGASLNSSSGKSVSYYAGSSVINYPAYYNDPDHKVFLPSNHFVNLQDVPPVSFGINGNSKGFGEYSYTTNSQTTGNYNSRTNNATLRIDSTSSAAIHPIIDVTSLDMALNSLLIKSSKLKSASSSLNPQTRTKNLVRADEKIKNVKTKICQSDYAIVLENSEDVIPPYPSLSWQLTYLLSQLEFTIDSTVSQLNNLGRMREKIYKTKILPSIIESFKHKNSLRKDRARPCDDVNDTCYLNNSADLNNSIPILSQHPFKSLFVQPHLSFKSQKMFNSNKSRVKNKANSLTTNTLFNHNYFEYYVERRGTDPNLKLFEKIIASCQRSQTFVVELNDCKRKLAHNFSSVHEILIRDGVLNLFHYTLNNYSTIASTLLAHDSHTRFKTLTTNAALNVASNSFSSTTSTKKLVTPATTTTTTSNNPENHDLTTTTSTQSSIIQSSSLNMHYQHHHYNDTIIPLPNYFTVLVKKVFTHHAAFFNKR